MAGPVPVETAVQVNTSETQLVAARSGRRSIIIFNWSDQYLYVKYGTGISLSGTPSFTIRIPANWYGTMPWGGVYQGAIYGKWAGADADGFALITELVN